MKNAAVTSQPRDQPEEESKVGILCRLGVETNSYRIKNMKWVLAPLIQVTKGSCPIILICFDLRSWQCVKVATEAREKVWSASYSAKCILGVHTRQSVSLGVQTRQILGHLHLIFPLHTNSLLQQRNHPLMLTFVLE